MWREAFTRQRCSHKPRVFKTSSKLILPNLADALHTVDRRRSTDVGLRYVGVPLRRVYDFIVRVRFLDSHAFKDELHELRR